MSADSNPGKICLLILRRAGLERFAWGTRCLEWPLAAGVARVALVLAGATRC
jgi:hypothetical protein